MSSGASEGDASVIEAALSTMRTHPRLLVFPALAIAVTVATFPVLVWGITRGIGSAARSVAVATPIPTVVVLVPLLYLGIGAAVAFLATVIGIANLGVARTTADLADDTQPSVVSGLLEGLTRAPTMLAYGVLAGLVGLLAILLERRSSPRGRYVFAAFAGQTYAALTYLFGPVVLLEDQSTTGSLYRSGDLLERRFGDLPVVTLTVMENVALVAALPLAAVQTVILVDAFGNLGLLAGVLDQYTLVLGAVPLGALWFGIVLATAMGAIGKTALYLALTEDEEVLPVLDVPISEAVTVKSRDRVLPTEDDPVTVPDGDD